MMPDKFRDKTGKIIPLDHFENEPGPPRDPAKHLAAEELRRFDHQTAKIRAAAYKLLQKKRYT